MKTKDFGKKLLLNKVTLTNLEQKEMRSLKGGESGGNTMDKLCYINSCVSCTIPQVCGTLFGC